MTGQGAKEVREVCKGMIVLYIDHKSKPKGQKEAVGLQQNQ